MRVRNLRLLALTGALALGGCPNSELAPLEPCTVSGTVQEVTQNAIDKVDLLFMVDNSNSMAEEQAKIAQQLPRMVRILASGDLEDGQPDAMGMTGVPDFPPVKDMHLGVVSSNLGAPVDLIGEQLPPTDSGQACVSPGDDGIMRFPDTCNGRSPNGNYLEFKADPDPTVNAANVQALGDNFSCISRLGTDGCGFEQQLDSPLKALVANPAYTFYGGSTGQGGYAEDGANGANASFLRKNAVLAVIVVSDEEDCSLPDMNAALVSFATSGSATLTDAETGAAIPEDLATPLNMRCGTYPGAQYPISRYVEGLRGLKPTNPELVIFAAISGIPPELEGMPAQDVLNNPAMAFQTNMPNDPYNTQAQPQPTCTVPNPNFDPNQMENDSNPRYTTSATPARRMVQLADAFGKNGVIRSICNDDFSGALDTIIKKISDQLKGACLPRALTRTSKGLVACDIVELIQDDGTGPALCDANKGRSFARTDVINDTAGNPVQYTVCKINQVAVVNETTQANPDPDAAMFGVTGWYYDDFTDQVKSDCGTNATAQRITFTPGADPPSGATVRFECLQPVIASSEKPKGKSAVGLSCEGDENKTNCADASCTQQDMLTEGGCDQLYQLVCQKDSSNTCQIQCGNQSECPNGWQCAPEVGLCVLPTCPAIEL